MSTEPLASLAAATGGDLYDTKYGWMYPAVETAETLEQFEESSKNWAERSQSRTGTICGMKFIAWSLAQARKGQPRESMSVIDLGDVRFAVRCDLSDFASPA